MRRLHAHFYTNYAFLWFEVLAKGVFISAYNVRWGVSQNVMGQGVPLGPEGSTSG